MNMLKTTFMNLVLCELNIRKTVILRINGTEEYHSPSAHGLPETAYNRIIYLQNTLSAQMRKGFIFLPINAYSNQP